MPLTLIFSWEILIVVFCLLVLVGGLVRITMRRQREILKEYLQPEQLATPPESTLLNPGENESPHETEQ